MHVFLTISVISKMQIRVKPTVDETLVGTCNSSDIRVLSTASYRREQEMESEKGVDLASGLC